MSLSPSHYYITISRFNPTAYDAADIKSDAFTEEATAFTLTRNHESRTVHFANVELSHACTQEQAHDAFTELLLRFPSNEGWTCTLFRATCIGDEIARSAPTPQRTETAA